MSSIRFAMSRPPVWNEPHFLISAEVKTDADVGETGLVVDLAITNEAGQFWNNGLSVWQAAKATVPLLEWSPALMPGLYYTAGTVDPALMFPTGLGKGVFMGLEVAVTAGGSGVNTTPTAVQMIHFETGPDFWPISESVGTTVGTTVTSGQLASALAAMVLRDTKLDDTDKKMKFYDKDGILGGNTVMEFDVKDGAGIGTIREVIQKIKV